MRRLILVILFLFATRLADSQSYNIATFAGGGIPGNMPATSASLFEPFAIASDRAGNVFLANGNAILRVDATTGILTLFAGNGTTGPGGDNGPAVSAQLIQPQGMVVDAAGDLYISDTGNYRVRKVSNGVIATVAGTGIQGFPAEGSQATAAPLAWPAGLALDAAGNLYVADPVSSRVYKISEGVITTFAGNGSAQGASGDNGPATAARLIAPQYLALDSLGNLYISDYGSQSVRKVSNGIITTVAGAGTRGFSGDNGPAPDAELSNPAGIAVDSAGTLYIADTSNCRTRAVSKGVITTVAGTGACGFSGDSGLAIGARLDIPQGIALDGAGDLFIADGTNYRIRKVTNAVIATVAGNGAENTGGIGGPAAAAQIDSPANIAADSRGDVYFYGGFGPPVIYKISNGVMTTFAGSGTRGFSGDDGPAASAALSGVAGIAVDPIGNLYIADGGRIREVSNGIIKTIAGTGASAPNGDNIPALAANLSPGALAVDAAGDIFFIDGFIPSLRKISGGVVTTVVSSDALGLVVNHGQTSIVYEPVQIAVDSAGSVFIPDYYRGLVYKVSNGVITTAAGGGPCSCGGDGGPAMGAEIFGPDGVAVDGAGNLYIAERNDSRVRKVSGGVITTIAGNRANGFSGDGGAATEAELNVPLAVAVDSGGDVYVVDNYNNRIRILTPIGPSCLYSISSTSFQVPASGGALTLGIQSGASCVWTISDLPAWVTSSGATLGTGAATVNMVVGPNSGAARSGTLTAAGIDVKVTQAAASIPSISPGGVVNAASSAAGSPLAPGSIASAYGYFFSLPLLQAAGSPLPDQLEGLGMQFGSGIAAPLFAVSGNQVNFQVPWELTGQSAAPLIATISGQSSVAATVNLGAYAPGIFAMTGQGNGQGAVPDTSYRLVDASNPATAGSTVIQIYCTGLGPVTNQPATGSPGLSDPLSRTVATPNVTIGGAAATTLFSGLAPGTVGEYQVNVAVPAGSSKGNAIPLSIQIGGATSNTVMIAVK